MAVKAGWRATPPVVARPDRLPPHPDTGRIKVVHVVTKLWGGAGENTLLSAIGMDRDRYETWIVACPGGHLWARAREAGVHTVELPEFHETISPRADLKALFSLVRLFRREGFTIVHTHMAKAGFLGRFAARIAHVPVVLHTFHAFGFHDFMKASRRRFYIALERFASRFAHMHIAVAPRMAREAVDKRLVRPGSICSVVSSVDLDGIPDRVDNTLRDELGIPAGRPIVGTVGRIVPQKAPFDFVRMARLVRRSHPEAVFVMIGSGEFEHDGLDRQVREEAERLGVDVIFTGFRDDAPLLAAGFDVFVITSLYEGLGRSLTEALASGRPVVATAVYGVPDLITHGSTGLLATAGESHSIAQSVAWLLEHPKEARLMGAQGRTRVRSMFSPENMCGALDELYMRLLGEASPDDGIEQNHRVISLELDAAAPVDEVILDSPATLLDAH